MSVDSRLLAALSRYAHTMAGDYDLTEVLHQLTSEVTEVLEIAGAGIVIGDVEGLLRFATASSDRVADLERQQEEDQRGPCAEAYETQEVITVEDIGARSDWPEYRKKAQQLGFQAVVGIPLSLRSERLGALNLYDQAIRSWAPEEVVAARTLADMAAGYMVHERLQSARVRAEQLQHALDSRVLIEQAKGILSAELGLSMDDAFAELRRYARNNNTLLKTVAEAVVVDGLRPTNP
jgi:GAF domain-containing protein